MSWMQMVGLVTASCAILSPIFGVVIGLVRWQFARETERQDKALERLEGMITAQPDTIANLEKRLAAHEAKERDDDELEARLDERMKNLAAQMTTLSGKLDVNTSAATKVGEQFTALNSWVGKLDSKVDRHVSNFQIHSIHGGQ